jgi:hypothetical protein
MHRGEERCIQSFDGKPEAKRPLGRSTRRWEYNIKTNLKETEWKGVFYVIWHRRGTYIGFL